MSRYSIRNAAGLFYSGNEVPETIFVPRVGNPTVADPRSMLVPAFGSVDAKQALKYDDMADATAALSHPDLKETDAFAGCEVVEVEFNPSDTGASRAVPVQ